MQLSYWLWALRCQTSQWFSQNRSPFVGKYIGWENIWLNHCGFTHLLNFESIILMCQFCSLLFEMYVGLILIFYWMANVDWSCFLKLRFFFNDFSVGFGKNNIICSGSIVLVSINSSLQEIFKHFASWLLNTAIIKNWKYKPIIK